MATIDELLTPCFVVDEAKVKDNCRRMRERCEKMGVQLRGHMKTHKTIEAADLMTNGTKRCIAVSTVMEAEFYADAGYEDILYAYCFTKDKLPRLKALAERLDSFHVMAQSLATLELLEQMTLNGSRQWSVFVMVSLGYTRDGITSDNVEGIAEIVERLTSNDRLTFAGLYSHDGDSYTRTEGEIAPASNTTANKMLTLKQQLEERGLSIPVFGIGSTPSCSNPGEKMGLLTEFHPGNYVFYDVMQALLGSCTFEQIAGRVATRVTGHYPGNGQLLVDCGFLALSQDGLGKLKNGTCCVVEGHPELSFVKMTQEIGIIKSSTEDGVIDFDRYPVASLLFLLPHHACATAAMHPTYYIHEGEKVTGTWTPCRGW